MNNYYTKLDQSFINDEITDWSPYIDKCISGFNFGKIPLLEYFGFNGEKLFKTPMFTIPPTRIRYATLTGEGLLIPHRDHGPLVGLNFYVTAVDEVTAFHEPNSPDVEPMAHPGHETKNLYKPSTVTEVDRIVAQSNDLYLLNVSKIHSVYKSKSDPIRVFIACLWDNHSYEEILENIIKTTKKD